MTKDEIIAMAREADLWMTSDERVAAVERFAKLVAEAERERMIYAGPHEWAREAIAAEREACAKIAEEANDIGSSYGIAQAIRARGQQ